MTRPVESPVMSFGLVDSARSIVESVVGWSVVRRGYRLIQWRSLAIGIMSCLFGYGLLAVIVGQFLPTLPGPIQNLVDLLNVNLPGPPTIAAWLFYSTHGVLLTLPTGVDLVVGPVGGPGSGLIVESVNPLDSGLARIGLVYPALVVGPAAAIAGRREDTLRDGAVAGSFVGLGYASVLLAGLAYASYTIDVNVGAIDITSFTIRVVVDRRFLLGVVAYPTVWATLVGALGARDWPDLGLGDRLRSPLAPVRRYV